MAVVVAILKSGLRIMPHSGGRVGRGIYFASEHAKSAAYGKTVSPAIMDLIPLRIFFELSKIVLIWVFLIWSQPSSYFRF